MEPRTPDRTIDANESLAQRSSVRAEYEAEFEVDPEPSPELARSELAKLPPDPAGGDLAPLLGPSPRTIIQRIELECRRKVRSMEAEVAEMMSREVALKESNRVSQEHARKLAEERDRLVAMTDPHGVMRGLREEVGRLGALYEGSQKDLEEACKKLARAREELDKLRKPKAARKPRVRIELASRKRKQPKKARKRR